MEYPKIYDTNRGYVYLLEGSNGRCKIGVSRDVKKRVTQFRCSSCEDHTILFALDIEDPYSIEGDLHHYFNDKRSHSEWFNLSENDCLTVVDYVEQFDEH